MAPAFHAPSTLAAMLPRGATDAAESSAVTAHAFLVRRVMVFFASL